MDGIDIPGMGPSVFLKVNQAFYISSAQADDLDKHIPKHNDERAAADSPPLRGHLLCSHNKTLCVPALSFSLPFLIKYTLPWAPFCF